MKKTVVLVLALICIFCLFGCDQTVQEKEQDDVYYLGLNAKIVEVDYEEQIVYVADYGTYGTDEYFGEKCAIDCSDLIARNGIIYVDYDTQDLAFVRFKDLSVGDELIINVYDSRLNDISDGAINVEQIQVATQEYLND